MTLDFWKKIISFGLRVNLKPFEIKNEKIVINPLATLVKEVNNYFLKIRFLGTHFLIRVIYQLGVHTVLLKQKIKMMFVLVDGKILQKLSVEFI